MQPKLPRPLAPRGLLVAAFALGFPVAALGSAAGERAAHAGEPEVAPPLDRARAAYDRGVRAHAAHDHVTAARAFAEADALAPQPASLEAALESAMRADDALLGAELVDRADGRPGDPGVARSLAAARKRFAGRTGKVKVDCRGETRCVAAVDGAAADARRAIYVIAGPHAVVLQRGEERIEELVEVKADGTVVVGGAASAPSTAPSASPTSTTPRAPADEDRRLAPIWFFVGIGVTAAFGGVTVLSGLDAANKHDRFDRDGCGTRGSGPLPADCDQRGHDGESAQLRTNVLLGATALVAVATVGVGVFAVRWKNGTRASLSVGTQRSAAVAGFELVTP
ncbi:MAG TPA: hypothetical protein VLT33_32960 [Labilithrix sp.]|nr:hypothetical protein [Labilithrix sp.]